MKLSTGNYPKATVLGAGAWGTALGKLLADQQPNVRDAVYLWARRSDLAEEINRARRNNAYLPNVVLPENLVATTNLAESLAQSDLVVFVAPSHATRDVARLAAPHIREDALIVSATKGIENDSLMFMDEVLASELPADASARIAHMSGPSFARELASKMPTAVVAAARDANVSAAAMQWFHTPFLRIYASDDVAGVECGGALKNVIAIAAGAIDGLGFGHNTRAALITRGLAEVARLAMARGGSALTLAGLAGMGDLVLTCTGELSRNRTVGVEMGRGRSLEEVLKGLGHVAEGVRTAKSAYELSVRLGVEMPITHEVYSVLYEGKAIKDAVRDLMARELGYEFDPVAIARATLGHDSPNDSRA